MSVTHAPTDDQFLTFLWRARQPDLTDFMVTEEQRRVRLGMVGGGPGAGIAETHHTAMRLDDKCVLVAGVFSRDRDKSLAATRQLRIDPDRVYPDHGAMAEEENQEEKIC
jgi:hypothetical protein